MNPFLTFFTFSTLCLTAYAKVTASYIVPTSSNLVAHSRFEVQIVKPYAGTFSDEISYIFPKELTGDPALQVNFKRLSNDPATGVSSWDANEMTATCTDDGKQVQCNMYLKFVDIRAKKTVFDFSKAGDFIKGSGLPQNIIDAKLSVLDQFLDSEPAGILSYEYN